jgi:hypothetical protein
MQANTDNRNEPWMGWTSFDYDPASEQWEAPDAGYPDAPLGDYTIVSLETTKLTFSQEV